MKNIEVGLYLRKKKILDVVKLSNGWYVVKTENSKSTRDFKVKTIFQVVPRIRSLTPKHAHFVIDFYGKLCANREKASKFFEALIEIWNNTFTDASVFWSMVEAFGTVLVAVLALNLHKRFIRIFTSPKLKALNEKWTVETDEQGNYLVSVHFDIKNVTILPRVRDILIAKYSSWLVHDKTNIVMKTLSFLDFPTIFPANNLISFSTCKYEHLLPNEVYRLIVVLHTPKWVIGRKSIKFEFPPIPVGNIDTFRYGASGKLEKLTPDKI